MIPFTLILIKVPFHSPSCRWDHVEDIIYVCTPSSRKTRWIDPTSDIIYMLFVFHVTGTPNYYARQPCRFFRTKDCIKPFTSKVSPGADRHGMRKRLTEAVFRIAATPNRLQLMSDESCMQNILSFMDYYPNPLIYYYPFSHLSSMS